MSSLLHRLRQSGAKFANITSKIESPFNKYPSIRISPNLAQAFIAKVANNVTRKRKDLTRIAYAKFHGILIMGYILNEFLWISNI